MSRTDAHKKSAGYTLLELLVALSVISLMALAMPAIMTGVWPQIKLRSAAAEIEADLLQLRSEAMVTGAVVGITLDESKSTYRLIPAGTVIVPDVSIHIEAHPDLAGRVSSTQDRILFYPSGQSNGGTIRLGFDGREKNLVVDWLTGTISEAADE